MGRRSVLCQHLKECGVWSVFSSVSVCPPGYLRGHTHTHVAWDASPPPEVKGRVFGGGVLDDWKRLVECLSLSLSLPLSLSLSLSLCVFLSSGLTQTGGQAGRQAAAGAGREGGREKEQRRRGGGGGGGEEGVVGGGPALSQPVQRKDRQSQAEPSHTHRDTTV